MEGNKAILPDKYAVDRFTKRRRMWVFVIAGQNSDFLKTAIPDLQNLFTTPEVEDKASLVMLRNTLLLFKIFNTDRIREARICFEGFDYF